jgi:hypothetical protein
MGEKVVKRPRDKIEKLRALRYDDRYQMACPLRIADGYDDDQGITSSVRTSFIELTRSLHRATSGRGLSDLS